MPAAVKADLDAPRQVARLQDKVAQLREQGASDDEIYRLRAQTFNPEAAARLADVDREEAAWGNRIGLYQAARQQILTSIDSPSQQQEALLGKDFPIIGVGGILSGHDAISKIEAGADVVQIYTGLIYKGPALVTEVASALQQMKR